ncbi:zinc knuckle [Stagonosporopsis vannaccii]|nr:zinc knuckle [Stagonosporopsis vannaccii]
MSGNTPKSMSNRLMTMKFMQRSAAKNVAASPTSANGPASKKVRLSNGGSVAADHQILQSALAEEAKKQQEALDKASLHTGETKWVLSYNDPLQGKRGDTLTVRQAGFAELDADDSEDDDDDEQAQPIRRQYGGGVKRTSVCDRQASPADMHANVEQKAAVETAEGCEGETESSSEDDYDSDDPTAELIRETKREMSSKKRESRKSLVEASPKAASRPINEDANLDRLTSLSGGRKPAGRDMSNMECFRCGQKGHAKADCPNPGRGSAGRGRGRSGRR